MSLSEREVGPGPAFTVGHRIDQHAVRDEVPVRVGPRPRGRAHQVVGGVAGARHGEAVDNVGGALAAGRGPHGEVVAAGAAVKLIVAADHLVEGVERRAAHEGAAECTKKCVEAGQKIVFVTDKDHKVLSVDNPDTLKDHLGHHVAIDGNVDASAGSIHVDNVSMM